MKHVLIGLGCGMAATALSYLIGAYVSTEMNPFEWEPFSRATQSYFIACSLIGGAYFSYLFDDTK